MFTVQALCVKAYKEWLGVVFVLIDKGWLIVVKGVYIVLHIRAGNIFFRVRIITICEIESAIVVKCCKGAAPPPLQREEV
jgi:hypothetical protein